MDSHKHKMAQDNLNLCFRLCFKQVKKGGHQVSHGIGSGGHVLGAANIDWGIAITRQVAGAEKSGGDAGGKEFPVPGAMVFSGHGTGTLAFEDFFDAFFDGLKRSEERRVGKERGSRWWPWQYRSRTHE